MYFVPLVGKGLSPLFTCMTILIEMYTSRQYQMAVKAPSSSRMSYSALSNEDIEFLKGKPNISKLIGSQQKLHKTVLETRALYRRASELDDLILTQSENIVSTVTDYILENSTVGPIE